MPPIDYKDIATPNGQAENMGGTKQRFFFAPLRYFDVIATVDPAGTTLASKVEIANSHTFLPGHGFHKIYSTLDKGGVTNEPQGERDGRSFKQKYKGFTPGSDLALHGMMSLIKNEPCIVLVEESDGNINQIGSEDYYAEILPKYMTGETTAGLRGYEIDVESVAPVNYRYTGTIILFEDHEGSGS